MSTRPERFINWILRRRAPEPTVEELAEKYLRELPVCSAKVAVAAACYNQEQYRCDIVADAALLAHWAEDHATRVFSINTADQAARVALPVWLRAADLENAALSYPPPRFLEVLQPYAAALDAQDIAQVLCRECGGPALDIQRAVLNRQDLGYDHSGTVEWRCEQGHLLYRNHFDYRVCEYGDDDDCC